MRNGKDGERERDREVDHAPLLDHVERQAVPVQTILYVFIGQALIAQSLPHLRESAA